MDENLNAKSQILYDWSKIQVDEFVSGFSFKIDRNVFGGETIQEPAMGPFFMGFCFA